MPFTVPVHPRRARLHGGDRGRGGEPEVVVAVPVDRDVVVEPLGDLADEERRRLGRRDARACRRRRPRPRPPRPRSRTRRAGTRGRPASSRRRRTRRGSRPPRRTRRPSGSARASSRARRRARRASRPRSGSRSPRRVTPSSTRASTSARTAREKPQISASSPASRISAIARAVVLGDAREARPRCGRRPPRSSARAISSLSSGREHDADRLLAVAQRRVVEADGDARLRLERLRVQVARPDLRAVERHCRTIHPPAAGSIELIGADDAGNGESFSAPSS